MKRVTQEWVEKAEGDYGVARRELGAAQPVFDAVCFHGQQCAEKYLKALLQERGVAFPRSHDLLLLSSLAGSHLSPPGLQQPDLKLLTSFAVDLRYPGATASRSDAEAALRIAADVRAAVRTALGLPTSPT
jgi:HEPN domain-containing protein